MAQATMAAIPGLRDTYGQLKTRMDKAVEDFRREMAATRTGRASVRMGNSATFYSVLVEVELATPARPSKLSKMNT